MKRKRDSIPVQKIQVLSLILVLAIALVIVLVSENSIAIVEWIMKYLKD